MSSNLITSSNCAGTAFGLDGKINAIDPANPGDVPEPATPSIVLSGLMLMGFLSYRRKT